MAFGYFKTFTVDHTQCGPSDSTDFPVLIRVVDADLKTVGNGGYVQSSSGYDIQPFSDAGLSSTLTYELRFYDGTTGTIEMWVKVGTLSHSTDLTSYLAFGDSSIVSDGSSTSTWNAAYICVWHLPDGTTLTAPDATSNSNTGTVTACVAAAGLIDGGADLHQGSTAKIAKVSASNLPVNTTDNFTIQFIHKTNSYVDLSSYFGFGTAPERNLVGENGQKRIMIAFLSNYYFQGEAADWNTGVAWDTGSSWYHIAVTFDGTTLRLVRNGSSAATRSGLPSGMVTASTTITAGGHHSSGAVPDALIDECRISNVARSVDWLLSEYNNQKASSTFLTWGSRTPVGSVKTLAALGVGP